MEYSGSRDGFLNLYKPPGMTSFMAIRHIKKLDRSLKIGHLGTLDPMAEGVLPLALGNATRLIPYINDRSKTYIAEAVLGVTSDTQDIWGQLEYLDRPQVDLELLHRIMEQFHGTIGQVPPMFSAVHYEGKRLYELARQGKEVPRQARSATIHSLILRDVYINEQTYPAIRIEVHCSEGTYIRTLCHDIGLSMQTGACLSYLQRTSWGRFKVAESIPLNQLLEGEYRLEDAIDPVHKVLEDIPALLIDEADTLFRIANGNFIEIPGLAEGDQYRIINGHSNMMVALAKAKEIEDKMVLQPVVVIKEGIS